MHGWTKEAIEKELIKTFEFPDVLMTKIADLNMEDLFIIWSWITDLKEKAYEYGKEVGYEDGYYTTME